MPTVLKLLVLNRLLKVNGRGARKWGWTVLVVCDDGAAKMQPHEKIGKTSCLF